MSVSPAELGDQIQKIRKARQLTLKELADRSGIGKTAMFDLEHGNPGVRMNTLLAVLHELDMDLELRLPESSPAPQNSASPITEDLPEHLL